MTTFYIVTPSFNQGVFLKQTLDSLFDQNHVTVISIVQDGGSSDESVKILKGYGKKVNWVSEPDKGQSDALNQGVKKVLALSKNPEQDIFAYLNSDDYYQPNVLDTVATYFDANPKKAWLVGDCAIVNAEGQPIQSWIRAYKKCWRSFLTLSTLLIGNPIPQPAVFIRVSALKATGPFEEKLRYTMDYQYWLRLWKKYGAPLLVPETLAAFRIHQLSKGGSQFMAQFDEELAVAKTFTKDPILVFGHWLHNALIKAVYLVIK